MYLSVKSFCSTEVLVLDACQELLLDLKVVWNIKENILASGLSSNTLPPPCFM